MARPKQFIENHLARFREGTLREVDALLRADEDRAGFIREAVEREVRRRRGLQSRKLTAKVGEAEDVEK